MEDNLVAMLAGAMLALGLAVLAWVGDRRRMHRRDPDAVGIMPWGALFFWSMMTASLLLAVAGHMWFSA